VFYLDCQLLDVQSDGYVQLMRALAAHPQLTHVALSGPLAWDTTGLPHGEYGVVLVDNPAYKAAEAVRLLRDNRSLERLSLRHFSIGNEGACGLATALLDNWRRNGPRLRELDLRSNCIGDAGTLAFLDVLPQLSALHATRAVVAGDSEDTADDDYVEPLFNLRHADNYSLAHATVNALAQYRSVQGQLPRRQRVDIDPSFF